MISLNLLILTELIKNGYEEIEDLLSRMDLDITLKTVKLRLLAQEIAKKLL